MMSKNSAMVIVASNCSSELDNIELLRACLKSMIQDRIFDIDWELQYLAEGEGWSNNDVDAAQGERAALMEKVAAIDNMKLPALRDMILGAL